MLRFAPRRLGITVLMLVGLGLAGTTPMHADEDSECAYCGCNKLIFSDLYHGRVCDSPPGFEGYCAATDWHWCTIFVPDPIALNVVPDPFKLA